MKNQIYFMLLLASYGAVNGVNHKDQKALYDKLVIDTALAAPTTTEDADEMALRVAEVFGTNRKGVVPSPIRTLMKRYSEGLEKEASEKEDAIFAEEDRIELATQLIAVAQKTFGGR